MARKREPKVPASAEPKTERRVPITDRRMPIRMDLKASDHQRMERHARKRDISIASLARMILVEWLDDREGGTK